MITWKLGIMGSVVAVFLLAGAVTAAPAQLAPPGTDYVEIIEFNVYGGVLDPKCVVIFRDAERNIIDWRWCKAGMKFGKSLDGYEQLVWDDNGFLRTVKAKKVENSRTREDKELSERSTLPAEKRRKLSQPPRPTVAAKPAAPLPPAPMPGDPIPGPPAPLPPAPMPRR